MTLNERKEIYRIFWNKYGNLDCHTWPESKLMELNESTQAPIQIVNEEEFKSSFDKLMMLKG